MMPEISLNILDVAQNSISAGARQIQIGVSVCGTEDALEVTIDDDGRGMTPEQASAAADPFFTTRTTRKVGLGLPFLKMAAEMTGGSFKIESQPGKGTKITAAFGLTNIDRMPIGDMASTMTTLIGPNPDLDFIFRYSVDERVFVMDTREMRSTLDGIPLCAPEVLAFISEFINENIDALGERF